MVKKEGKKGQEKLKEALVRLGLAPNLPRAEALILADLVRINGAPARTAGILVKPEDQVTLEETRGYVSRAAYKLLGALSQFNLGIAGKVCADVGSSTGGFTQVLLEKGASKVFAIDVGYGELAWKLRSDPRVVVLERSNVRHLVTLPERPQVVTIDVSFISLNLVLPVVAGWADGSNFDVVALIKPQFEAQQAEVPEGGVIADPAQHRRILERVLTEFLPPGFGTKGLSRAAIKGTEGNQEFVWWLGPGAKQDQTTTEHLVLAALGDCS